MGLATATSLTFAVAIGLAVVNLYMAGGLESIPQRVIGGLGAIVGAWTIIAILVFASSTAVSLGFVTTYLVNVWLRTPRHQGGDVMRGPRTQRGPRVGRSKSPRPGDADSPSGERALRP